MRDGAGLLSEGSGASTEELQQEARTWCSLASSSSPRQPRQAEQLSWTLSLCFLSLARLRDAWGCTRRSRCSSLRSPPGSWKIATAAPPIQAREKIFAWLTKTKLAKQNRTALLQWAVRLRKCPPEPRAPLGPAPATAWTILGHKAEDHGVGCHHKSLQDSSKTCFNNLCKIQLCFTFVRSGFSLYFLISKI